MRGLGKAFRLEMRHITESRIRLFSHFLIPIVITIILGEAGAMDCSWCYGYTYFNYYASLIFSTSMVFIATQLTVLRIVGERAPYGTLDRDLLAISRSGMYLGKFFAGFAVVFFQSLLFVLVGMGLYNMLMRGSSFLFLGLLVLVSMVGLIIGLFFSVITKTKEQAVQLVPFAILIFLVLSGDLIPISDMPSILRLIAENSPITIANEALRSVMLKGEGFQEVSGQIYKLVGWIAGGISLGLIKFSTEKK